MSVIQITEQNFKNEVLESEKTVIVDFYAVWCGPCKTMSPIIDSIAEELGDTVKVGKVDTDENMNLAGEYGILSIPTILIFKNGEVVANFVGVTGKEKIIEAVKNS